MKTLITAQDLNQKSSVIFDCRAALLDHDQGRREYEAGHIPGAVFADLESDLSAEPGVKGRHPLPDRDELANFLRLNGVNNASHIVCYDQNSGAFAARLWWLLRWLGHDNVQVLDGGLDAWIAKGGEMETTVPSPAAGDFVAGEPLNRICFAEDLLNTDQTIVDARDVARFRGEVEPIDKMAGHIPGAICLPFTDNLNDGRFKDPASLKEQFAGCDDQTICYCGSGVTAAHNILAMCHAGLPEPVLYPGSWSEWIESPDRPIATGDE